MRGFEPMLRKALVLAAAFGLISAAPAFAATTQEELKDVSWSFEGPFGKFDVAQLQRGYKVYHDVCSACHSMNQMHYFDLGGPGGPFYKEGVKPTDNPYVKAIAADFKVPDVDTDSGDTIQRPATPADKFKAPFPNEYAARASNGGALPPDLSLIVLARDGGAQYVYSLLTGYVPAPAGLTVPAGKSYNPYMPGDLTSYWHGDPNHVPKGGFIAMPFQLTADRVTFDDGTPATTEQEAKDVVAFLSWASDPHQIERKQIGFSVLVYLFLFALVTYASYRKLWRKIGH
jgi:ubiquinol-cytochrome c reductase cytochrome c1 subunit